MATAYNPSIVRDGLVLCSDAANPKSILNTVEVLVVAGGGGGGAFCGGGGGAGGLIYNNSYPVTPGQSYTVTVGAGGVASGASASRGTNGSNSVFGGLTAIGGGGGASLTAQGGLAGGSGGGDSHVGQTAGAGTAGQGFAGGRATPAAYDEAGGGGGGAGAVGITAVGSGVTSSTVAGIGGPGLAFGISGSSTFYAGGGAGGVMRGSARQLGGAGGGGNGAGNGTNATSGTANTGGGGGGGGRADLSPAASYSGGDGGSGIVIVRYFGPARASGGTITSVGGYTIHTFTSVGNSTFTPNATWSDLSGNANSGTLIAGPTYSSANGGYISFNGTSNYITNSTNLFSGRTTTTGAYWVYITAYPSGNVGVLHMWNGVSQLAYDTTSGGIPQFWINGALIVSGNQLSLNTWHYMTWVTDGAFARIYTNGVLVNSGAFTAAIATSAQPMYIFRRSDSATYMAGRLSSLSVYNRALSAAEIQQNFNAHRGRYGI